MGISESWDSFHIPSSSRESSLSGNRKYFTLAEANRTLPLVKRIVSDLVSLHPQWRDLVAQYELVSAQARPEWGESTDQLVLRGRIDDIARQINDFLLELDQEIIDLDRKSTRLNSSHSSIS